LAEKTITRADRTEHLYSSQRWKLLEEKRRIAEQIMGTLEASNLPCAIHGSVARGDVEEDSDVDVLVPQLVPSYQLELSLSRHGYKLFSRMVTQATPSHSPKGHIYLDSEETASVTFPLLRFKRLENEFYKFGGMIDMKALRLRKRVPGVSKRLILIEPTENGHIESQVIGRESEVAEIVGVSPDIVKERVRVLTRRDKVGRTGVFLVEHLSEAEQFEEALKRIIESNPAVRREYLSRKGS
jgi:predicted nucleotidyltransferase